jgi:PAS domain S-box-containing protein
MTEKTKKQLVNELAEARDRIAELETSEAELKQKEQELRRLGLAIEQTAEGVATADLEGNIQFANEAWAAMHGYTVEEILGKHLSMFHTEEQLKNEVTPFNEQTMAEGQSKGQIGHVRKDGTTFPTRMTVTVVRDEAGNPIGLMATTRDITKQVERQAALQESEQRFRGLYESSPLGIILNDYETGDYLEANDAFLEMVGYTLDELNQLSYWDLTPEKYSDQEDAQIRSMEESGHYGPYEKEYIHKDGTIFPVVLNGVMTIDNTGRRLIWSTVEDISERKRAEEERERLQQEVIEAQKQALQELSTPIIPIMDRIIVMPLVGSVDTMRARDIMRRLLAGIREHRAKVVILDITGVPIVDSGVADHLNKTIQAARLKGARTIVTGVSDAVAETIVDLGIDWSGIETLSDLQTGLVVALNSLDVKLSKT